jgi:putative N6-adenine-specific DNA methylase
MQFLVVPLGLEDAALNELEEVSLELQRLFGLGFALKQVEKVSGGIEFESDEKLAWAANSLLKIPSRILQRWLSFKVRDFPSLYKKLSKSNWKTSLFKNGIGKIHIAASASRLNNEKRLMKLLLEVLAELKIPVGQVQAPDLYFRMHDDIATLSIDTTGEHLHFRGYRQQQGEAPLRENFAAFVWSILIEGISLGELADYNIVDPMAGSGTLLFEALLWDRQINSRLYTSTAWLDANTKEQIHKYWSGKPFLFQVWGFDYAKEVLLKAQENFKTIQKFNKTSADKSLMVHKSEGLSNLPDSIAQFQFFDLLENNKTQISAELFKKKRLLLSNPPYGERLQIEGSCLTYCEKALEVFTPEKAVFLVPDRKETRAIKNLGQYIKVSETAFLNNGIRVLAQKWVVVNEVTSVKAARLI